MASFTRNDDLGKLLLRLSIGVLVILHGIAKIAPEPDSFNSIGYITNLVTEAGLPAFVAYGVYVGEIVAPLMVILGFYSRMGGLLITANMLFAIGLFHPAKIFELGKFGGWALELQGLFLFGGLAIFLLGSGRYALKKD